MTNERFDALLTAAEDGVDFDGLEVEADEAGYRFSVPGTTESGLSSAELRDVADRHASYVQEWYFWHAEVPQLDQRWAFLRWIERADARPVPDRRDALREGSTRTWGQLAVTAHLVEAGRRAYQVRHVDDVDEPVGDLTVHTDPTDLRDVTRHDDCGRYRPLSTAPTLPNGWVLVDLDPAELVDAVESVYPATVANWYRERNGELDVAHWRETAERQTGIYDLVDELSGEQVDWLAEACCVDSQCLKRREWDESVDRELDASRGSGDLPCREPCSIVVAAAREFALAERETPEHVEGELTPSERQQIHAVVDAAADGRLDDVRLGDFDDPANRYRVRYLRAKRFHGADGFGEPSTDSAGDTGQ